MRLNEYTFKFLLLVIAQILLWNFFNFSQYLTLTLLPAMMLTLPHNRSALYSMPLAFIIGLCVDLLCGVPGLCSLALVPVAFVRRSVMGLIFGSEMFVRGENLSFSKHSPGKIFLAETILTAIFLLIYIWVDGAGTRSLWFNLIKGGVSLLVSAPVSFFIVYILCSESQTSKWK